MSNPFNHLNDDKLMALYKNGEFRAFEVLYTRYKDNVYTYLRKRIYNKNEVDDIFQQVFVKFHKSRMKYNSNFTIMQFLYTITKSELLDYLKKNKKEQENIKKAALSTKVPNGIETNIDLDIDEQIVLSKREKTALKLRYISDQDFLEISENLNTSEVNARKLISRAIKKIRKNFQGENSESKIK